MTIEVGFHNTHYKTIESDLVMLLRNDVVVNGYALDHGDGWIHAIPVKNKKARIVFKDSVRNNKKVSVMEKVDSLANVFKIRVYPIHPSQKRKVRLFVLKKMTDNSFLWDIEFMKTLKEFKINGSNDQIKGFVVSKTDGKKTEMEFDRINLDVLKTIKQIEFSVSDPDPDKVYVDVEKNDENYDDVYYFSVAIKVENVFSNERIRFDKSIIYFDVSYSRRLFPKEVSILKEILEKFNSLTIVPFSNTVHEKVIIKDLKELNEFLNALVFDGATKLPLEKISKINEDDDIETVILITDGINNYGKDIELEKNEFNYPIVTINSSKKNANVLLQYLSKKSGGKFIDLRKADSARYKDLFDDLIPINKQVKSINFNKNEVSEIFYSFDVDNVFTLYGKILSKRSNILLNIGEKEYKIIIDVEGKYLLKDTNIIRSLWTKSKLDELSLFPKKNGKIIEEIGIKCRILTDQTSLLILTDLKQYKKFKILPPKELRKIRKEYLNSILDQERSEKERIKTKIDQVYLKWKGRIDWHQREFVSRKMDAMCLEEEDDDDDDSDDCMGCALFGGDSDDDYAYSPPTSRRTDNRSNNKKISNSKCYKDEDEDEDEGFCSIIKIKPWKPNLRYMHEISTSKKPYLQYLKQRSYYSIQPSFYLDVSNYFLETLKKKEIGIKILSNILELEMNDARLLRIVGYRLDQEQHYTESINVFKRVKYLRPEEPQSYRDLALIYEKVGKYEESLKLLWNVVIGNWNRKFSEIELCALIEMNHVIYNSNLLGNERDMILSFIDKRFIYKMDLDIRISMAWDTDNTDIDLHVYDSNDEHCFYGSITTTGGGLYTHDFTEGYGPEEFLQKHVDKPGKYLIKAKYYANHQQKISGATTILCSIFLNYMRDNERSELVTLRLQSNQDEINVSTIDLSKPKIPDIDLSKPKIPDIIKWLFQKNHHRSVNSSSNNNNPDELIFW